MKSNKYVQFIRKKLTTISNNNLQSVREKITI